MLVIFYLSSEGSDLSSQRSDVFVESVDTIVGGLPNEILTFLVRKLAHITAYFVLGLLFYTIVDSYKKG
ncbi:MAG: hypothetical protein JWN28_111, partial [Candidatus Saccharibacteria bacterium]|nr:hypothetical protein [Candidatus Saccharibacteria bacterium]